MTPSPRDPAVQADAQFGRAAPALGWVPAPRYLLRRAMILEWMAARPAGRILEIGAGPGALLADLAERGFTADAVETSARARELASRLLQDLPAIRMHADLPPSDARYDLLFAFEVLEHIADARAALARWVTYLLPGARVMLSVPAYADRWTATDTWAGHVRRYDRDDFVALVQSCGLRVLRCRHYGFPLTDLMEPINARRHARLLASASQGVVGTSASGVERGAETRLWPWMRSLPGRAALRSAIALQRRFPHRGNGLLLEAEMP